MRVEEGIYEQLVTQELHAELESSGRRYETARIDAVDEPHLLARHVSDVVYRHLTAIKDRSDRLNAANDVIRRLDSESAAVEEPARQLLRIYQSEHPGLTNRASIRPTTPLSEAALLTNASGEPSIGHELPAELASADSVDLVCAFIRWSGVRLLEAQLATLADTGKPFRVITTTYLGSTERETLDRLVRNYGAQVRVQYDNLRTRLHAKAWLFRRHSGYDTAYIGSSNLSNAAMIDGVEWNVRLSRVTTPALIDKFTSTFETYWNSDPSFESYDPDRDRDRLDDALAVASGNRSHRSLTLSTSRLEVRPYPYQQIMLEELQAERDVHGRHRNLIVAATGTGKTVLAALDYRRIAHAAEHRPRLLFVAHREEILNQALRTFQEVLTDPNFGELYVAGARPERWDHVFASVQSLSSYVTEIPANHFEVVIIDEFHHASARTYRQIVDHLQPNEMVALTATPERADGIDVRHFFDGRIASELRLWDALEAELLCPFHYFGIADGTDLSRLSWKRGGYETAELETLYTGDDARARIVLNAVRDKIVAPLNMRALGFCVSVRHAEYMARVFTEAGIPSASVSGKIRGAERTKLLASLGNRSINAIFSVDVFNEGVDIKEVDTIFMLRPTESATVFLQQLGRGLRRTESKPILTILDFVGNQREEFRWDLRLRALTGGSRRSQKQKVIDQFPTLPSGCRIVFDKTSQEIVLASLQRQLTMRWKDMVRELQSVGDITFGEFLDETELPLANLVKDGNKSWTRLRRDAGHLSASGSVLESEILKRNRAFSHVDDPVRAIAYRRLLSDTKTYSELSDRDRRLADMLIFSVWPTGGDFASLREALELLRSEPEACKELIAITDYGFENSRQQTRPLAGSLRDLPLQLHAHYQREEILAALGVASLQSKPGNFREGVKYIDDLNVDAFFVTLTKSDTGFSPTTMYRDYPISRRLFHWESQSTTTLASRTGQRYVNGTSTVLLFVRHRKVGEFGPMPYMFIGPATMADHRGERPIAVTWRLSYEMPAEFFHEAKVAAG